MSNKIYLTAVFLLGTLMCNKIAAQSIAHEVGFVAGPLLMKSDYGERGDISTNFGNTGFGVGLVHYMNFSAYNRNFSYFSQHFKVRSELSYFNSKLNHFGRWIEGKNNLGKEQLRAMEGKTSILNLGMQLEFFPLRELYNYERYSNKFAPYVSLGVYFSYYNAKTTSKLGELGLPATTLPKYLVPSDGHSYGFASESSATFSISTGAGIRYKASEMSDILLETRVQYFGSDWVDGLNPNKNIYAENKANDWLVWLNFGYIYYLD